MGYSHQLLAKYSKEGDSVIDLMAGKGDSVSFLSNRNVILVDIYEPYIKAAQEEYKHRNYKYVVEDSVEYLKSCADKSVDVVQCIDGIEHLPEELGLELLYHAERVAKNYVVIFTPDGLTENHPHNAWGIQGGDIHQKHLSGWTRTYMESRGYICENYTQWTNAYNGTPYYSILMVKRC